MSKSVRGISLCPVAVKVLYSSFLFIITFSNSVLFATCTIDNKTLSVVDTATELCSKRTLTTQTLIHDSYTVVSMVKELLPDGESNWLISKCSQKSKPGSIKAVRDEYFLTKELYNNNKLSSILRPLFLVEEKHLITANKVCFFSAYAGEDLEYYNNEDQLLTKKDKVEIIAELLQFVRNLYAVGYVNYDFKPANLAIFKPTPHSAWWLTILDLEHVYAKEKGIEKHKAGTLRYQSAEQSRFYTLTMYEFTIAATIFEVWYGRKYITKKALETLADAKKLYDDSTAIYPRPLGLWLLQALHFDTKKVPNIWTWIDTGMQLLDQHKPEEL